jgi:hypothetical protein
MDSVKPQLPTISNEDRTPLIDVLLELLAWQQKQIDQLEQEILKLKGETTKPEVKPGKMDKDTAEDGDRNDSGTSKKKKGRNAVKPSILRSMPPSTSNPIKSGRVQPLKVIGKWSFRTSCLKRSTPAIAWLNTKRRMVATFQGNSLTDLTVATLAAT